MMTTRRIALVPVAALVGVLALAGCGSSSESSTDTGNGGGPGGMGGGNFQAAFTDYIACMKEQGVTITLPSGGPQGGGSFSPPDGMDGTPPSGAPGGGTPPSGAPTGGTGGGGFGNVFTKPDGVSEKTWTAATKACESTLPQRGNGGGAAPSASPSVSS